MKAVKKLIFILVAAACAVGISGCSLIESFTDQSQKNQTDTQYETPNGDNQSQATYEVNADNLMAVREKIRAFNISIDTKYYKQTGWISRTAGTGLGSGVVFEEDENYYYALTNNHVITDVLDGVKYRVSYTVTDIYGTEYSASLVMSDGDDNDVAIVKFLKSSTANYTLPKVNYTARLNSNMTPGEFVLAVGNPSGVNNIVTYGEVLGWKRIGNVSYNVLNHNALINPGNSGGALCDMQGNLLGLNTWGSKDTDDNNFSIPLKQVNEFIDLFHRQNSSNAA